MSEKTMTTEKAMRTVETEITIDAPVDAVWRALTDADEMERWFPLEARVEPGPDGHVFMSWKNEIDFTSPITAWDENRRFAYAWQMESAPGPMVADFHLEAAGGKTVLRLVHSGFPSDPSWDGFYHGVRTGWAFELRSLRHYLERYAGASKRCGRGSSAPTGSAWPKTPAISRRVRRFTLVGWLARRGAVGFCAASPVRCSRAPSTSWGRRCCASTWTHAPPIPSSAT